MKYIILILVCVLFFSDVIAQNQFIGFKAGVNWANISSDGVFQDSKSKQGKIVGISYEYFFNNFFSLESGMLYENRGFKDDYFLDSENSISLNNEFDYLSIPLKVALYRPKGNFYTFAKVGLVPAFLIRGRITSPILDEANNISRKEILNVTKEAASFDISGIAEVGVGYEVSEKLRVFTSISYQHSITSLTSIDFFSNNKMWHRGLGWNFGLMWSLQNKIKK